MMTPIGQFMCWHYLKSQLLVSLDNLVKGAFENEEVKKEKMSSVDGIYAKDKKLSLLVVISNLKSNYYV